jgi:hypothetical protein
MAARVNKSKKIFNIVIKHWRSTIGSLMILVSIYLLIFKVISTETMAAIVAALIAAGYIPKAKSDESPDS